MSLKKHCLEQFGTTHTIKHMSCVFSWYIFLVSCQEGALHCLRVISFKFHKVPYSIPPEEDPSMTEKIYQCKTAQLIITVTT